MGKILCCWELGEDYGHIGQFFPVIKAFTERGHHVYFAVKDLSKIGEFEWPVGVSFLQSPLWLERPKKPVHAECYAEIILYKGYDQAAHLKTLAQAWQHLLNSVAPDLLILDHSPTALLASRGMKIPRLVFSNAFVSPPAGSSPVNLRPWQNFNEVKANDIDTQVSAVINQVCADLQLPVVTKVSDLFAVEKTILTGFYELDFYRGLRSSAIYCGALPSANGLQRPAWSPGTSIKIFAYLKAGREQVARVLSILASMQARVVCFYSGARQEDLDRYRGTSVVVSDQLFDASLAYRVADAVICHAGGMVYSALNYGLPMILLPTQVEQHNRAIQLTDLGVATLIQKEDSSSVVEEKLKTFFNTPGYKENALAYAEKIKATTTSDAVQTIINASEDLISNR